MDFSSEGHPDDTERTDLPFDATAAGRARERVGPLLSRWQLPEHVDSVTLLASELVSNAVRHGRPDVSMTLSRHGRRVRLSVHDENRTLPAASSAEPDLDAEGGRGMFLVSALAAFHGVDLVDGDGKHVWAVVGDDA